MHYNALFSKLHIITHVFNTKVHYGCPYDCGLCTDHEQHSCLSIVEVTDRCNLACPTCYASSGPNYGNHRTLEEIEKMFGIPVFAVLTDEYQDLYDAYAEGRLLSEGKLARQIKSFTMKLAGIQEEKKKFRLFG